jgi:Glycosyl hydrolase family 9/Cellulase N-terminal ig-like domain
MLKNTLKLLLVLLLCSAFLPKFGYATPVIYINQVAFDSNAPKTALIGDDQKYTKPVSFTLVDVFTKKTVFTGTLGRRQQINEWMPDKYFYKADFSAFRQSGKYELCVSVAGRKYQSEAFRIGDNELAKLTIPSVIHYYHKQRADKPNELANDAKIKLYGSDKTVDLRGGWCDASGDVSKYFSHLAYANFMSPQQIPLVTWSMVNADEAVPKLLTRLGVRDSLQSEALWGADYIMRSLSDSDYFYMTVFSYFSKDPNAQRVVGLHANSVTTNEYQCAFREGGGMAIAALARISRWKIHGDFTSKQYLNGAERAFAHLLIYNKKYDDDHKENIIDDYCALMAATELWITTNKAIYKDEAHKRAHNLSARMTKEGYFISDDGSRPYWHASDAGLPIIALARYLSKENNPAYREAALQTIRKSLDYELKVTADVSNPFGYARQTFRYKDSTKNGFFIPHDNETGWWWQGENARLSSLATAAIVGSRLVYNLPKDAAKKRALMAFAYNQVNWILGDNPYQVCFMYKFGRNNVPYMHSMYGHGSERGGISNGITGKEGNGDGSGIDYKTEDAGNEWRWTEQWIPHAAWYLQAVSAMAAEK